jgi:uncharacterized protein YbjT (DUF2867 family)
MNGHGVRLSQQQRQQQGELEMQKVLVAGATGYLGRFVVREFKNQGYWVRALARNPQKLEKTGPYLEPAVRDQVDEVFVGEVTDPRTLSGLCDGIDIVFSSIGITRQRDGVSFMDVDYQGNKNLLELAMKSSVTKFIFVSVFKADIIPAMAEAREMFVRELKKSGLDYAVIRPTGYFSDMSETLKMAKSGRVWLVGDGHNKINPIHGADLAKTCVDAVEIFIHEIPVGGPETYQHREIAEMAFSVLGKPEKITAIPIWLVNATVKMIRPFSKHYYTLASFFATVMQNDFDAPKAGTHSLRAYFEEYSRANGLALYSREDT